MQLAHFLQRYPPAMGGSEAYFARLSRWMVERGHSVEVFTSTAIDLPAMWYPQGQRLPAGSESIDGVQVHRFDPAFWPLRRYMLKALSLTPVALLQAVSLPCNPLALRMLSAVRQTATAFDAVHASAFPYAWPIVCAWHLARRQRIPFLLTPFLHLGDPESARDRTRRRYLARPFRWLLERADAIFVQTPSEAEAVRAVGIPETRIMLQGLGVEPSECTGGHRARYRQQWQATDTDFVIGHLANQSVEKGSVDLLQAMARAWQAGSRAKVVLAGPEMPNFQQFWGSFPHQNQVIRLGVLTEAEKRDYFAAIDAFALPSRSDSFGLVLLEAWANRLPNVAYRAGGVADVIRDGVDGRLVPCGDVAQLAEVIREWESQPELRQRLATAGHARLPHDYCWADKLGLVESTINRLRL
ncbi:glycosyltransferase family 4 protein [Tuwongella immobilis]|uniref:Glycosyltransferase subfamily 4-like N-terminal domain-containing protein n=1 Tax=Tuwongella immobilis TaxID=692036 RepID=A0A6C2YV81_9BACT|nr:glycosyltransferase family 4 protein [Tuwongella immobilis]VIP05073.1 Glycosyltransferase OS=Singulisphaera acidiphila (strain ATCC BAA-1392 / DSM 18658 / VKM B-2454 / MOB10) GN=Sinac_5387 PE=4 SV=1: Glyco_trans_4_4: Glycos_transf_1 [Tuwongella immobilis]VTS07502.1 Glycosyltransferase OS=Singulisphaera acidiphila (strain ATCC BAA-1392 / DSM 18658 / VKM B-2454 / MOB10) GN=Sinac_5387 PE=4 SV=1: Glyco_trans_4_4: Glycos_transf_1 [Tuwongella immobilis]